MLEDVLQLASSLSTLTIFAITLAVVYVLKSWTSHPSDLPPMPCMPAPILGHALFMKPTVLKAIQRWHKQVGDIFTLYLAGKRTIVISNYDLLTEALIKKADYFSDRPYNFRNNLVGNEKQLGIVPNSKEPWKQQRSVTMSILRSFGMGKNLMAERISGEVRFFIDQLNDMKGEAKSIDLLTNAAVSNVICAIILGERFDYNDPFFTRLVDQTGDFLKLVPQSSLLHVFHWLRYLPGDLFQAKRLNRISTDLRELFGRHFIHKFKDDADDDCKDNYIKAYLREMNKRQESAQPTHLDEDNLIHNITHLFIAGTDTTSTTILWAVLFAIRFQDIQEKIYKEIEEVVGTERMPTIQDRSKLNFFNAFVMETQRFASIAPLAIIHTCTQTTQIGGYTIPEGTNIIPNLDAVLKDPKYWKDPEVFRPERFLDDDNKLVSPGGHFLPFSLGRRICLGESLAKMELFIFLSAMFQRFKILPEDPSNPPPLESVFGIVLGPKPFNVRFKARV